MLKFLFPRLTPARERGAEAFAAVVRLARNPAYYRAGLVPDTLDGRFAMLATMAALAMVRLERDGAAGDALSVALTERFVEALEAEHRELGMSDPTLGRTMRKLVGALARRVETWRGALAGTRDWAEAARASLPAGDPTDSATAPAAEAAAELLRADWRRLDSASLEAIDQGLLE